MFSERELLIFIDGKFYPKSEAKISVYDHGFLYGDGVFEGIRAYNGIVFKLKEHIDRLFNSAKVLMINIPYTKEEIIEMVLETLRKNNLKEAYIRLIITRGIGDLGLDPRKCPKPTIVIITQPWGTLHGVEAREKGIRVIIQWVRRDRVDATSHEIKSLNYLNSVLAKIEANNAGVDEALFLSEDGCISEGVGENIFIVKNGKVFTTMNKAGILPGITREVVIEILKNLGYEVIEKDITPYELFTADEVFFTGTAAEVTPISEVNGRIIGNGKPGPLTKKVMEEFFKATKDPKNGIPIYEK
jgi:branched-chain amino acid aminotransferase